MHKNQNSIVSRSPRARVRVGRLTSDSDDVDPTSSFREETLAVLTRLRASFGVLLESCPSPIHSTGDLQRVLGLDKALAWQVLRVGTVVDPIEAAPDVPTRSALERVLRAADSAGVPRLVTTEIRTSFETFDSLVERHASDRGQFDAMARGLRTEAAQVHTKERRAAYRGNMAVWGVQAQTHYNLSIFHTGATGVSEDCVQVVGYLKLRKLRASASGHVIGRRSTWSTVEDGHGLPTPLERRTIDILEPFSTTPLPNLRTVEVEEGKLETRFEIDVVGRAGEVSYFVRDVSRSIGPMPQPWWGSISLSRVPTETAIIDVLVPVGWSNPRTARVETFGNLRSVDRAWARNDDDRLPVIEEIVHMGSTLDLMRTPHVPSCPEIVRTVLEGLGWTRTSFDIYRCVVQYPILCAGVATRIDALSSFTSPPSP